MKNMLLTGLIFSNILTISIIFRIKFCEMSNIEVAKGASNHNSYLLQFSAYLNLEKPSNYRYYSSRKGQ